MHASQVCMAEIVPDGANGSLIEKSSAVMSMDSEYVTMSTAENNTKQVGCSKIMQDQVASHHPWLHEFNEKVNVNYSDIDLITGSDCSDCQVSEENAGEDCEAMGTFSCQNLAWLNFNSNGRTTKAETRSENEPNTEKNCDKIRRTKQPCLGQNPLEPVGLSLSSSGVQLFLMVNSDEKKKLLSNTKAQLDTDTRKTPMGNGRASTVKRHIQSTSDVNATKSWTNVIDFKDNKKKTRMSFQTSSTGIKTSAEHVQGVATSVMPVAQENLKSTYICNREDKTINCPCQLKLPLSGKLLYGQGRGTEAQPLLVGPSWRFDNEEIDVSNNEDNREVFSHRDKKEERQHGCLYDDSMEKPFERQSCEFIKRRNDQYPEGSHQDKRAKRHHSQKHIRNPPDLSKPHYRHSSSDDDVDMHSHDEMCTKMATAIKTKVMTEHATPERMYTPAQSRMIHEPIITDGRTLIEHADSHLLSRTLGEATSSTTVFPNSRHSSSTMDFTKMAKFTEYTENMRKNIKQDYRNLSTLIKSFTEDVQERNNNQSSLSRSDCNQPEKAQKMKNNKDRCTLM